MSVRARWTVAALGLMLLGCPKPEAVSAEDRLLKKLQAEKDRLEKGGTPARPSLPAAPAEPSPLAVRAAMPDVPKTLPIAGSPDFSCGLAACRVSSVETSHSIGGEKMSLTSDDYFIKVVLSAQRVGGGALDLSAAKLVAGSHEYPIARDAQLLAGSRELSVSLEPDQKVERVLLFEAPKAAIAPGLKLVVVGSDGVALQ